MNKTTQQENRPSSSYERGAFLTYSDFMMSGSDSMRDTIYQYDMLPRNAKNEIDFTESLRPKKIVIRNVE